MKKESIYKLTITAILTAIIIIMTFIPAIGYLKIGVLSITFLTVPVIIGAVSNGPGIGAVLGLVFGLTSFMQCFGIGPDSPLGTLLLGFSPVKTAILCIVPRVLIGVVCGFIYKGLSKTKAPKIVQYAISAISAPLTNTILFMGTLVVFFWKTDVFQAEVLQGVKISVFDFIITSVGINGIVELIVCSILGTVILIPLQKAVSKYQITK